MDAPLDWEALGEFLDKLEVKPDLKVLGEATLSSNICKAVFYFKDIMLQ
jgi:hypothetical protein